MANYRFLLEGSDYFLHEMPPSPFQHYWSLGLRSSSTWCGRR
ncbi:putative acyltransferase domain protein [Mycobacterium xenopi 3993]|nr:putative acyltransferase domain protein [Mycobacterium xenopi 3993]